MKLRKHLCNWWGSLVRMFGRECPEEFRVKRIGLWNSFEETGIHAKSGRDSLDELVTLALLQEHKGGKGESEMIYRKVLGVYEQTLGPDHRETLEVLTYLGVFLAKTGNLAEAESLQRRRLSVWERSQGLERLSSLEHLEFLAETLIAKKDHEGAAALFRRQMEELEREIPPEDLPSLTENEPDQEESQSPEEILADLRMLAQEAELLTGTATERYLGLAAANAAALFLYGDREQIRESLDWARKAWTGSRDILGHDHAETLRRLMLLARILGTISIFPEKRSECRELWRTLIAAFERCHGANHATTLTALDRFAHLLEVQLNDEEALPLRRRIFDAAKASGKLAEIRRERGSLVRTLTCLGDHAGALQLLSEAVNTGASGKTEAASDRQHLARYQGNPGGETLRVRIFQFMQCLNGNERNAARCPQGLDLAADVIAQEFEKSGYRVARQQVPNGTNLEATSQGFVGNDQPHYLVGTHYSSPQGCPGADALSGVAVLLEAARIMGGNAAANHVRFVVFTNEPGPQGSGSEIHSRQCRARGDAIAGVICLDSLGYFSAQPGSQQMCFPPEKLSESTLHDLKRRGIDPETGNFLALLGNPDSLDLLEAFDSALDLAPRIPVAALTMPDLLVSDHQHYWNEGFPAVLLTDTTYLRNPHYAQPTDTFENLQGSPLGLLAERLAAALVRLPMMP